MTEPVVDQQAKAVDMQGRPVTLKTIAVEQVGLLMRESRKLQRDEVTTKDAINALGRIDRILSSLVVFDEDRDYVDGLLEEGKITYKEIVELVMSLYGQEPEKPKVIRRGRPPKRG